MSVLKDDSPEELKPREKIALRAIVEWIEKDPLHQPPTHRELLERLNELLPKQKPGNKPALVGTEQTNRLAEMLRRHKLLVDVPASGKIRHRNLVPTAKGERLVKQWRREETQK
jgi:hypothetical protein